MPACARCRIAQSLPPGKAEITQELKCSELRRSMESNYLFSDKFRVKHIFFKEKQAVVSGGSRERSALALGLPGSRPGLHQTQPKAGISGIPAAVAAASFPLVLGVKELCGHSQPQAIGTEQGWRSLSEVSVRVPAAPAVRVQGRVSVPGRECWAGHGPGRAGTISGRAKATTGLKQPTHHTSGP